MHPSARLPSARTLAVKYLSDEESQCNSKIVVQGVEEHRALTNTKISSKTDEEIKFSRRATTADSAPDRTTRAHCPTMFQVFAASVLDGVQNIALQKLRPSQ